MKLTTSISEKRYVALITDADRHTETDPLPKQFDALVGTLAFPMLLSLFTSLVIR